jgi:benzoyl-CoA reductase/2-hydroxyglutaryl-CoA dehydratase subunit BcrC/BadD/HgdB
MPGRTSPAPWKTAGPSAGCPRPDMLVCCNNICGTVLKWYEVLARYFNVPLFILDTPVCHTEFPDQARNYVRKQFDEYIAFLEKACGKPFDVEKSLEVGRLSIEGQRLWQAVLDTTAYKPAPMTAFDAFFFLASSSPCGAREWPWTSTRSSWPK